MESTHRKFWDEWNKQDIVGATSVGLEEERWATNPIIVYTFLALLENMWLNHSFCGGTTIVGFQ